MSNKICIQRCEFVNYPNRRVTYGFRAYDDYRQTYLNTCSIEQMTAEPLQFLKWLVENVEDAGILEMIDFAKTVQSGLYVDDTWYDWDEIRHVLEPDSVDPRSNSGTSRRDIHRKGVGEVMITVGYSIYRYQSDTLLLARDIIFEAMVERAAAQLELEVQSDRDEDYTDIYVAELNVELASQLLDLLDQVDLLTYLTVDVSTTEEYNALLGYASRTAIEVVPEML